MGVRLDPDKTAECATGAVVERVFVKEIAGGVRRDVVLQGAGIEFLFAVRDSDGEKIAARAFTDKPAQTFESRISGAEMQVETHGRCVVIDRGRVHLQRAHVFAPSLRANVSDLCARAGNEIVDATSEARGLLITGREVFYYRYLRQFVGDEKQMRKDRHVVVAQPMEDLDRQFDFDAARHEQKCAR